MNDTYTQPQPQTLTADLLRSIIRDEISKATTTPAAKLAAVRSNKRAIMAEESTRLQKVFDSIDELTASYLVVMSPCQEWKGQFGRPTLKTPAFTGVQQGKSGGSVRAYQNRMLYVVNSPAVEVTAGCGNFKCVNPIHMTANVKGRTRAGSTGRTLRPNKPGGKRKNPGALTGPQTVELVDRLRSDTGLIVTHLRRAGVLEDDIAAYFHIDAATLRTIAAKLVSLPTGSVRSHVKGMVERKESLQKEEARYRIV